MPVMIICTPNPWDVSKMKRENISEQLVSYMTYLLNPFGMNPFLFKDKALLQKLESQFQGKGGFNNSKKRGFENFINYSFNRNS